MALVGKRYLNTATGKGSASKTLDFHNGDLYEVGSDGAWHEYMPKDSWVLTHMEHTWAYFNGQWNLVPGIAHEHDRLVKGEFTFFIDDNGNFNKRKKSKAQAATVTPQAANMAKLDGTVAPVATAADATTETDKILHFSGSLIDWLPNEEIERGYLRRANFMVGNSERITNNFILVSNVDRTTNATFDIKEIVPQLPSDDQTFNNYSIAAQLLSPNWLPGQLAMQGMRVKLYGFLGEYTSAKITNEHFDLQERSALKPDFTQTWETWHEVVKDLAAWKVTARLWIRIDGDSAMPMAVRTMDMPDASHGGSELISPGVYRATLKGGTTVTYRTSTTRGFNDLDMLQFRAGEYSDISWEILDANKAKVGNFGTANGGSSINSFMTGLSQGFTTPFPPGSAFIRYKLTKAAGGVTVFDAPIL